jgi:hypothetical protein
MPARLELLASCGVSDTAEQRAVAGRHLAAHPAFWDGPCRLPGVEDRRSGLGNSPGSAVGWPRAHATARLAGDRHADAGRRWRTPVSGLRLLTAAEEPQGMPGRHAAREADPVVLAVRRWQETHPVPPFPAECVGQAYTGPPLSPQERYTARRRLDERAEQ